MNKYDLIVESLCEAVSNGDISEEFAESVNDLVYEKYVIEADDSDKSNNKALAKSIINEIKSVQNENKSILKQVKNLVKNKKYDDAINSLLKIRVKMNNLLAKVKEQDKDIFPKNKEYFLNMLKSFGEMSIIYINIKAILAAKNDINYPYDMNTNGKITKKDRVKKFIDEVGSPTNISMADAAIATGAFTVGSAISAKMNTRDMKTRLIEEISKMIKENDILIDKIKQKKK